MRKLGLALLVIIIIVGILVLKSKSAASDLVGSNLTSISQPLPSAEPTPLPSSAPKTYEFDSTTDLEKELETINPQVLDSDFP